MPNMAFVAQHHSKELTARVEDYLNDKFQTSADFENIDGLLEKVREQQHLLQKQLEVAQQESLQAQNVADAQKIALTTRASEFQRRQTDIDEQLLVITQSKVGEDAAAEFEQRMSKVRQLEIATGYIETLKEVEYLNEIIRKTLKTDPQSSIAAQANLSTIFHKLKAAQPAAEGAAPHLIDHVQHETLTLYNDIKTALETEYQKTLDKMNWPKKEMRLSGKLVEEWHLQTDLLLQLQESRIVNDVGSKLVDVPSEPPVLLPLAIMINPLILRFRYHFYGEKPTNRLDKPEYFFSHFLDVLDQNSDFITTYFQPILDARIRASAQLENTYTDAISSFISGFLPTLVSKCLSLLPQLSSQPQLFSHMIHEMMAFDENLRNTWAYSPLPGPYCEWKGVTWEILNTHGYFSAWLNIEKDFALSRYKKIRDSPESSNIDYDGVESGRTKPTKGAIRVNDLLETITERYKSLISFSQKMKFLMDIQLAVFDDYHNYLHGALQAYLVSSHTAGRLIQGQTEADAVGLKGLESLAKVFGSAEYLEQKMLDWSDDVFFLELWDELQDRARRNGGQNASLGKDLTVDDVAAKTSTTIKTQDNDDDAQGGALFDETARSYRQLRERSEVEIARALEINSRNALRPLTKVAIWSSLSTVVTDPALLTPSSALDGLLQTLSSLLEFLGRVLAPAPLRRVTKQLCQSIQKEIFENVLLRSTFSAAGAAQLNRDVLAIAESINTSVGIIGEAQRHMRRIQDALTLIGLPIRPSKASDADEDNGGWDFEGETEADDNEALEVNGGPETIGLWQAEKALFASNDSARKILGNLHIQSLSENEARNVIKRRLEVNS